MAAYAAIKQTSRFRAANIKEAIMAIINNVNEVLHHIRVKLYPNYLPGVDGQYIAAIRLRRIAWSFAQTVSNYNYLRLNILLSDNL